MSLSLEVYVLSADCGWKVLKSITENEAGFIRGLTLIMTAHAGVTA